MKHRLTITFALIFIANLTHSQIIDRYGINIGTSYSSQIWDYKLMPVNSDNKYKFGLQAFLQAEKDFGNIFAFRTELGYIQKGFKNNLELRFADGTSARTNNDNVVLHDLALNLGLKIKPLKTNYSPYLLLGLRCDYMISYKDIVFEEQASGLKFNMYESIIEEFNKFNLGGLFCFGIDIKNLIYFEIEYNPNFTKSIDDTGLSIKDNCWGAKLGLNINKLTK
ncbi:MAG: PorT family protein [Bacteroidales bacterium]|nr:PorT family protein [Bacteroidales bacterium]